MRPKVLGALCVFDGALGVLIVQPAHDGRFIVGSLDHGAEQHGPLVILQHRPFAHRRGDLDHGPALDQPTLYPPLGQLGHQAVVHLEVVVERRRHRGDRANEQTSTLFSVHRLTSLGRSQTPETRATRLPTRTGVRGRRDWVGGLGPQDLFHFVSEAWAYEYRFGAPLRYGWT